ncbi:MAG: DsbA family protein [Paracoccaceae bacterium]
MISLDIISDPICPWCYIGKANLDRALEGNPDHPFLITWHPFQLNPDMPAGGVDRRAYLEAKFGKDQAGHFYARIEEAARSAGLDVDFSKISRTPNTVDPHRLIHWGRLEGRQTLVVSQLFHRYFRNGDDISDHAVLLEVARTVGMDTELVRRLLASDADVAEVREEDSRARRMGVNGVPVFVIGGRQAVTGAQPAEFWSRVISELTDATAKPGSA